MYNVHFALKQLIRISVMNKKILRNNVYQENTGIRWLNVNSNIC